MNVRNNIMFNIKGAANSSFNNEEPKYIFRTITMRTQREGLNCSRSEFNHLSLQILSR